MSILHSQESTVDQKDRGKIKNQFTTQAPLWEPLTAPILQEKGELQDLILILAKLEVGLDSALKSS